MTSATLGGPATLWDKVRANYTQAIFLGGIAILLPFAYFAASAVTPLIFLMGALLLGHLRSLKAFAPVAAVTAAILILAFFRSDFVVGLAHGKSLGQAAHDSKMYFRAPMIMWFGIWALVCAAYDLSERQSARVMKWLALTMLVLTAVLGAEAASHFGLRDWINRTFFKAARSEMVVVRVSNSNFVLLYLFWPLTLYFMARRWTLAILAVTLVICGLAIVVDTNAQILALVVSTAAFFATKYWPRNLWRKGLSPERILAVATAAFILAFPFVMLWLMRAGLAEGLATHVGASWRARFGIWGFAVLQASHKPFWGLGFEAARNFEPIIPNHPHSLAIQAWLELGIPGLALLAALWFFIFWCMAPKGEGEMVFESTGFVELSNEPDPVDEQSLVQQARPYVVALAVTYFFVNAISFGIWRDWLYTQGAFAAAAMILSIKAVASVKKFQI